MTPLQQTDCLMRPLSHQSPKMHHTKWFWQTCECWDVSIFRCKLKGGYCSTYVSQVSLPFYVSLLVIGSIQNWMKAQIVILKGVLMDKFDDSLFCPSWVFRLWLVGAFPWLDLIQYENYYLSRERLNELLFLAQKSLAILLRVFKLKYCFKTFDFNMEGQSAM